MAHSAYTRFPMLFLLMVGRYSTDVLAEPVGAFTTTQHAFAVPSSVARSTLSHPSDLPTRSSFPATGEEGYGSTQQPLPFIATGKLNTISIAEQEETEELPDSEQKQIVNVVPELTPSYYDFQQFNIQQQQQVRQPLMNTPVTIAVSVLLAAGSFGLLLPVSSILVKFLDRFAVDAIHVHWDSSVLRPVLRMLLSATEGSMAKITINSLIWIKLVAILLGWEKKQRQR
eukprot:CAMPEP_0194049090 /NCGR_PEP_ID=MMETSP0009_2-20130614/29626_1 /TAXON_ID=210454 /ORGANISM="Grammatophora oceanica, Strain CCMP 410" /LENGTH=227 /DNA_ID=CAMNT_0038695159 /DNA_START=105 /DNA_END=788 /DNA_ORIENTATION=+